MSIDEDPDCPLPKAQLVPLRSRHRGPYCTHVRDMTRDDTIGHTVCTEARLHSNAPKRHSGFSLRTQLMNWLFAGFRVRGYELPSKNPTKMGIGDRSSNWPVSSRVVRHLRHATAIFATILAAACSRPAPSEQTASTGPIRGGSLTASLRSEPNTFNRFAPNAAQAAVDAVFRLTQATLVRINRATGEPEPWLAEKWITSPDQRTITLTLRDGVVFSDGVPFTSADVLFSFNALYDRSVESVLASAVMVQHKPLQVSAPDARTVVITLPAPFAPGAALLDNVPIYPKHLLEAALKAKTFGSA